MKPILLTLAVLALLAGAALAGDDAAPTKDEATTLDPAKMDGKELYRNYCKTCHQADSPHGEYTPMSLIMDQWDEVFDALDETHAEQSLETTGGQPVPVFLTDKMLSEIRKFCIEHAADSESPMTCG